ncbi:MAG TPA: hypothetical protein VGF10_05375 [Gaiella sp.]|jgi:hypothetical protein
MDEHSDTTAVSVDEAWLREWAAEGIAALERLLAAHAAFDEFLSTRQDEDDGRRADAD